MKNLFAMTAALMMGFGATASNVELVVEAVDNNGTVPGNTYRVYAVLPSAQHSLHAVFAAEDHVLNVATTGSFFQHQYGSYSSLDINESIVAMEPGLAFDSWVTVGAKNSEDNNLWTIGVDYNNFLAGQELTVTDGAWFVVPTDVQAAAAVGNKVLLMQLTTDGTATGVLNLQGRDGEGGTWRLHDLTFSTDDAKVFGCTDATAANYKTAWRGRAFTRSPCFIELTIDCLYASVCGHANSNSNCVSTESSPSWISRSASDRPMHSRGPTLNTGYAWSLTEVGR